MIAQFPIEDHSEQGQFAEWPFKTIGKVQQLGDYYAIRSSYNCARTSNAKTQLAFCRAAWQQALMSGGSGGLHQVTMGLRPVPNTNLYVSPISLGTMTFGTPVGQAEATGEIVI